MSEKENNLDLRTVKFIYFPCRGNCDPIRLLLVDQNINYKEYSVTGSDFRKAAFQHAILESKNFPNLPFYADEEIEITGANVILRHLAMKYSLVGNSNREICIVNSWIDNMNDLQKLLWNLDEDHANINFENKKNKLKLLDEINKTVSHINYILSKSRNQWILDSGYSVADIVLYSTTSSIVKNLNQDILLKYEK